jgi:hypothetical protein
VAKFEKGTSGNPGGRPKSKDLRDLCRTYTAAAVEELARLALNATGQMVRVQAIRELLDRGYGRPMQALEVAVEDSRPQQEYQGELTPPEVLVALGEILTNAERQMGISSADGLTSEQRVERMLKHGVPIPPDLYKAVMQMQETRH